METREKRNVVLIGMPGSGKSTLGVLLAKALGFGFVDADLVIQRREGRLLQELIDERGIDAFLQLEEAALCAINEQDAVISTGGSAVYSEKAMRTLRQAGVTVYLDVPFDEIERRITNISTRGIVLRAGNTLRDTYEERCPLYEAWADLTVACAGRDIEQCVREIVDRLSAFGIIPL